jgi:protoheme IX farnesyltransferase
MSSTQNTTSITKGFGQKLKDYQLLFKFRLSMLVVFSACITYCLAAPAVNWQDLSILSLSSCLITWAASALNQVLEKDTDKLMTRTANRPLAAGRMEVSEAVLAAGLMSVLGLILLAYFNPISTVLGALSLISYSFIYTPLKKVSPAAVWVGAVPGALPMAIGWVAATNQFGAEALFLFSIQFFWQFPHFWAIAWIAYEDYSKAGFYLLPSKEKDGRNRSTALQSVVYALCLIPISFCPIYLNISGGVAVTVMLLGALVYTFYAVRLYMECNQQAARKLMFASFFYLPIVLIVLLLDKI